MTIARALDSDNIRVRSLASIKRRREKARMQADQTPAVKQFREVTIPDTITVSELANRMTEKTADVVRELMKNGIMATATEVIDSETAELITTEFGHKPKRISESDVELDKEINSPTSNNTVDPNEKDQQTSIDKVTKVLDEVKIVEDNPDVDEVLELHSDKGKKISESASKFAKVSILRVAI